MSNDIQLNAPSSGNLSNAKNLECKLNNIQSKNGALTSIWDSIKSSSNIGASSKKCEEAINAYINGEISYEEANALLENYEQKQADSINLFSSISTGVVASLVVGSAVLTGGLSLGAIAAAGCVGGVFKCALKMFDRATNELKGDALNKKEISKDFLSGALDGAVSVGTMGLNVTPLNFQYTASNTFKQAVFQGVKQGAKSGAISGAVMGGGDYTINALVDEDIDFKTDEFLSAVVATSVSSSVMGGAMGGITNGFSYANKNKILIKRQAQFEKLDKNSIAQLSDISEDISKSYTCNNQRVLKQTEDIFADVEGVEQISARTKGADSVFTKLAKARVKGNLNEISNQSCYDIICDAYGSRVQIASLSVEEARLQIEDYLADSAYSYDDFIKYISSDRAELSENAQKYFELNSKNIYNRLKEAQTEKVVSRLESAIRNKEIKIKNLENYGDVDSAYFTKSQLERIALAHKSAYNEPLVLVAKIDPGEFDASKGCMFGSDSQVVFKSDTMICLNPDEAIKPSGYATAQMNVEYLFDGNKVGYGELQIRGVEVNPFADTEHIPYDIKAKKITQFDTKYKKIYDIIKPMPDELYDDYNKYLTSVYKQYRANELGLPVNVKSAPPTFFDDEMLKYITKEGLFEFKKNLDKFSISGILNKCKVLHGQN